MFQVGDKVVYSIHGVCEVAVVEEQTVDGKKVIYLVLEPLNQPGSRYLVPTHNAAAMSKLKDLLTREELEMLFSDTVREDCWIQDENRRKQTYRELIGSGNRQKLIGMLYTLYRHKSAQAAAGRKVHICDDNFLRDAEKLLISEVSTVMGLDADEAKKYIRSKLQN